MPIIYHFITPEDKENFSIEEWEILFPDEEGLFFNTSITNIRDGIFIPIKNQKVIFKQNTLKKTVEEGVYKFLPSNIILRLESKYLDIIIGKIKILKNTLYDKIPEDENLNEWIVKRENTLANKIHTYLQKLVKIHKAKNIQKTFYNKLTAMNELRRSNKTRKRRSP